MSDRLLSMSAVLERVCMSKTSLYRRINSGEFPKPVGIARYKIAFVESEVEEWIAARVKERDQAEHARYERSARAAVVRHRRDS